jgi:hypothetical protein
MKIAAILLMLLLILIAVGFSFVYLLGFAMSFDAPGSTSDPKAWGMRFLMFLPILIIIVVVIFSFIAYNQGNYRRAVLASSGALAMCSLIVGYVLFTSFSSLADYKAKVRQDEEDARKYPKQYFTRQIEGGRDTIIVYPNRIVAYRIKGPDFPLTGPVGDLNETRDALIYKHSPHNDIKPEDLDQFMDEQGKRFTDIYRIQ